MTTRPASPFVELSFEQAYKEVRQMTSPKISETNGVKVYTGEHKTYGACHIIIPMMGDGMMLFQVSPVVLLDQS